jgi:hypothetical protein
VAKLYPRAETINRNGLHFPQFVVVWFHWFLWSQLDPPWFLRLDALRQGIHGLPQLPSLLQRLLARPCQGSNCIGRISYRVLLRLSRLASYNSQGYRGGILTLPVYIYIYIYILQKEDGPVQSQSQKSKSRFNRRPVNQYVLVSSSLGIKGVPSERISIRHQEEYIKAKFIKWYITIQFRPQRKHWVYTTWSNSRELSLSSEVAKLLKNFRTFYRPWRFITLLTRDFQCSLSLARLIQYNTTTINELMMFKGKAALHYRNSMRRKNILCGVIFGILNVKVGGIHRSNWSSTRVTRTPGDKRKYFEGYVKFVYIYYFVTNTE